MKQSYNLKEIINSQLVKAVIKNLFENKETEVVKRPASFIVRLKNEPEDRIFRIILLPPHGFTANRIGETTPHPEARKAKIEIKGGVRPDKIGFSLLKNVVKYQYYLIRNIKIIQDELYPPIDGQNYQETIKSSKQKFFVVKEDGTGFYHTLVNLSDEWVLLVLDKELRLQKIPDLQSKIGTLDKKGQKLLMVLYDKILLYGDIIFEKEKQLIEEICNLDIDKIVLPLIEMLNVLETGKHESCTVYAIILKIGKTNKKAIDYLREAIKKKIAPKYYLEELIKKLVKQ